MVSQERRAGVARRATLSHRLLQQPPAEDTGFLAEYDNDEFDPPRRLTANQVPDALYTDVSEGWARDAKNHGWFGGTLSSLEWIEAQNEAIRSLKTDLATARRAATKASAAAPPRASTTTTTTTPPAAVRTRPSLSSPRVRSARSPPGSGGVEAVPGSPSGGGRGRGGPSDLALSLSKQKRTMDALAERLRVEEEHRSSLEKQLERERAAWAAERQKMEREVGEQTRRAEQRERESRNIRAERDQLEWLLKRVQHPNAPQTLEMCHVCGRSLLPAWEPPPPEDYES